MWTKDSLECDLGLGLCGAVLGDALVGVANMLIRLSIIEMKRCDWIVAGNIQVSPTQNSTVGSDQ